MPFPRRDPAVPADIGRITVHIAVMQAGEPAAATMEAQPIDAAGAAVGDPIVVDLVEHLPAQRVTTLNDFMTWLRGKATSEIVP